MDSETLIVACPSCGTKNRVPRKRLSEHPRCGRCQAPLPAPGGSVLTVTDANFAGAVLNADLPVLLDCWAPWCGPCKMIGPIIEDLAGQYAGRVLVGKLNVDDNPRTAQRFQIRSIPTLLILKKGRVVDTIVGAVPRQEIARRLEAAAR